MTVLRCGIVLFIVLVLSPLGIGQLITSGRARAVTWAAGFGLSTAVFEILCLVFHGMLWSLRLMVAIWCIICAVLMLLGFIKVTKAGQLRKPELVLRARGCTEWLLLAMVVLITVLLTGCTVFGTIYINWDDQTYCATAVSSLLADTVNRGSIEAGKLVPAFIYDKQYSLPNWPIYNAMLALLTGVHPAIVYRTILPLFEIPLAMLILGLFARCFWKDNRKKILLTVLFAQMLILMTAENMPGTSAEWWLVVNCWTGKSLAGSIVIPLVLLLLVQLEEPVDAILRQDIFAALIAVCWGSCLISGTLFIMIPVEVGIWGSLYVLRTKQWQELPLLIVAAVPAGCCMLYQFL